MTAHTFRTSHILFLGLVTLAVLPCTSGGQTADTQRAAELYQARNVEQARELLHKTASAGDPWGYYWLGRIDMGAKPDSAAARFERAITMRDSVADFHLWLGRAYGAMAENANMLRAPILASKVKHEWERAIAIDPRNIEARKELIAFHMRAPRIMGGDHEAAKTYAAEIRRLDPYQGALMAADIADRDKELAQTENEYRALIRTYPDSSVPVSRLGSFLHRHERWDDAFAVFDAMLKRHVGDPLALYGLGKTAALSGKRLTEGEQALQRYLTTPKVAIPDAPSYAGAHLRLGGIAERRGDVGAARKEYQTALALEPMNRDIKAALDKLPS